MGRFGLQVKGACRDVEDDLEDEQDKNNFRDLIEIAKPLL